MKLLSFTIATSYHASVLSMESQSMHSTLLLRLSVTIPTRPDPAVYTTNYIQAIGGGQYRYAIRSSCHNLAFTTALGKSRTATTGRDSHPNYHFIRQNTADTFPREKCISRLPYSWKYPQKHSPQTFMPCSNVDWLYSNNGARSYEESGRTPPCAC
jgi:hypothetical protein